MQMDARIILAGQQPDFANALAGGVQAGQAVRQAQQQNALADLYKTQGAGIMSGDQNALNALAQISPQAAYDIMGQRQQMDARSLDMQATRQRMDMLTREEARQVEQYAASKTAEERAAEAAQIEDAVKMGMMIQSPEQWDQVMATRAPDLVGQFANRDALAGKYMTMAEILKQTQGDPAAITAGAPQGYMWTDPNNRTAGVTAIPGYQANPADEYGRYVAEEKSAGRAPLSRLAYEQAKKVGPAAETTGAPTGYMWKDPNNRGAGVTEIPGYQSGQIFRNATPDEAALYGAAAGQFGPDGRFYPINPPSGMTIETGPDGSTRVVQGPGAGGAKPFTDAQGKSVAYSTRARGALEGLDPVAGALTSRTDQIAERIPLGFGREVQSSEFQLAKQYGDEFLQAILRKDTGAAITAQEQELYGQTYLPQPGDSQERLTAKAEARQRAVLAMEAGMSPDEIIAQERALQANGRGGKTDIPRVQIDGFTIEALD